MTRARCLSATLMALTTFALVGCAEPQVDMQDVKPPPRPAELDRLDMFVGTWQGTAEMTMPGTEETVSSSGINRISWRYDQRFVVEEYKYEMGDLGDMAGLGVWSWDPATGKYRNWWFNSWGEMGTGTATYSEETKTWRVESQGTSAVTGKPSYGRGEIKIVDDDTMEWSWKEWDNAFRWGQPVAIKGTNRRE